MRKTTMRIYFTLLAIVMSACFTTVSRAASIGTWNAYMAYSDITEIEQTGHLVYVLASKDLYVYNTNDQSIQTFDKVNLLNDCNIAHIAWCQQAKRLIIVYENQNIDLLDNNNNIVNVSDYYNKSITGDKTVNSIYIDGQYAYLAAGFGIVKVNVAKAEISDSYNLNFNVNYVYIENGRIFASSRQAGTYSAALSSNLLDRSSWTWTSGFVNKAKTLDQQMLATLKTLKPGGPQTNDFSFLRFHNGQLYTSNGLIDKTGMLQILKDDEWSMFQNQGISQVTGYSFPGLVCFDFDPQDDNHVFACSRNGVYEFRNGQFVKHYNHKNSPIEIFDGIHEEYELVEGLKFDAEGNLWCLNSQAPTKCILKLDRDGNWSSYDHAELMKLNDDVDNKSLGTLERMILDSRNLLWFVNDHWSTPSLYCYNPATDQLTAYTKITNQDATSYAFDYVRCVKEDKSGRIWIGTNVGPFYLEPTEFNSSNPVFTQVKVPRNDGTNYADYLLSGVDISAIAIDAGGRKWFGTYGNGVYLISEDNITQIQHFTTDNSKLISNNIEDIAINDKTGEVFFATSNGLCSYMSDATTPSDEMTKDNVYAYPNPVTPEYTGLITIVGLSYDADIKIVTSNGTLVAQGRSNGGSFTWNGCDKDGKRVASGIYMVMSATNEGKKGTVCKIAVIN